MRRSLLVITALCLAICLSACQLIGASEGTEQGEVVEPTATEPAPTLEAAENDELPPEEDVSAEETGPLVLTVWTAERHAPSSETAGGQVLLEQLAAFDNARPDIQVEVYVKRVSGPGGMLSYLRNAPAVAPDVLPDLVLLDRESLVQANSEELVVPIEGLIDPALTDELYPAAISVGSVDGTLIGLPYVLETEHVVYRTSIYKDPPVTFEQVLESPEPFIFPAGTIGKVNRTTLTQYLAAGGILTNEDGEPALDEEALLTVLTFTADAREAGIIDPALFQLTDPAESVEMYIARQTSLAVVTSTDYLREVEVLRSTSVATIPTPDGQPFALTTGWSWCVTTDDLEHQSAVMALLNFMLNPINQGEYTQASGWLPTQSRSLTVWGDGDEYAQFADDLLANAVMRPSTAKIGEAGAAIQQALEDVLIDEMLPAQATGKAIQAVTPDAVDPAS